MPMELAMKLRRSMPSFFDFPSARMPISFSTCFCLSFCGLGMNSSLETTCVGTGESTPFMRSRCHLGIHMSCWLLRLERKQKHGTIRWPAFIVTKCDADGEELASSDYTSLCSSLGLCRREPIFEVKAVAVPLFVCHANCCRSVLAKYLYEDLCPGSRALSAGVEVGDEINDRAAAMLRLWGIDASAHTPRRIDRDLCDRADVIFLMGPEYLRRLLQEYGHDLAAKAYLFADPFLLPGSVV